MIPRESAHLGRLNVSVFRSFAGHCSGAADSLTRAAGSAAGERVGCDNPPFPLSVRSGTMAA